MNKLVHRTYQIFLSIILALAALILLPSLAQATDETASVGLDVAAQGQLYKEAYRPASWSVETLISTSAPSIYPLRRAELVMPGTVRFQPDPAMPVCPDSEVGPDVNVSAPVDTIIARCPNSVLGNGTAIFQLAGINGAFYERVGYIVIFNGGRDQDGDPKIKVYAYSYATTAAVYTESSLKDGKLSFEVPRLSFDSAVTSLNLSIPGEVIPVTDPTAPPGTTVPAGSDAGYVEARCPGSGWTLNGSFLLGNRDSSGQPIPPESTVMASAEAACTGLAGQARFGAISVKGPKKVKRGKKATYRVTIPNAGTARATGVRLKASGRGVSLNTSVGAVSAESSRTVTIQARFKKAGKVRVTFKAVAGNASAKKLVKTIRVS